VSVTVSKSVTQTSTKPLSLLFKLDSIKVKLPVTSITVNLLSLMTIARSE